MVGCLPLVLVPCCCFRNSLGCGAYGSSAIPFHETSYVKVVSLVFLACSTMSECLAHGRPLVFVRRDFFNEEPFLRKMLEVMQWRWLILTEEEAA